MNIPISTLTDEHINKWIYEVSKINKNRIGNNLSDRPYRCAILMKAILEFGMKKQYCSSLLDLSFGNKVPQVTNVSEKTKNNYINYKDFLLLCEAIKKSERKEEKKDRTLFIFSFLYYTGVRISEARAVKRKDIVRKLQKTSRSNKYMHYVKIYGQIGDDNLVDNTLKGNNPSREVRILKDVYDDLIAFLDKYNYSDDTLIFDFEKKGVPFRRQTISELIRREIRICKEQNLLPEDFIEFLSPHGFRYSNTIYLKNELNVPLELAAQNQGHTVSVMLDIYSRIDRDEDLEIFGTD